LLLNYTFGVFVFWVIGTIHELVKLKNPLPYWKKAAAFSGNILKLWILTPKIIRNKPHFYKML